MKISKHYGIASLLGLLLLGVWYQAWREAESSGLERERFRLVDSFATPVIRFVPPAEKRSGIVAVLVHGHHCNKAMMAQLARSLAAGGIDTYSIDLPGHGESREAFFHEKGLAAAQAAVGKIIERSAVPAPKLVLIGHSFGSVALAPVALRGDALAAVFLGPGKPAGLGRSLPNNALIVTAENDYEHIKQDAKAMYDSLTASDKRGPGILVGDFRHKDARLWAVIPGATHLSLLFDQRVYRLVGDWIERSTGESVSVRGAYSSGPAMRAAGSALALSLLLTLLVAGIAKRRRNVATGGSSGHWIIPAVAAIVASCSAVLLSNALVALPFLRFEERDVLALLLVATGVLGLGFLRLMGRKIAWRPAAMDLALAAGLFLSLYGLALLAIDGEFYNLRIAVGDRARLATLGIFALLAVPVFLLQQELSRGLEGASGGGARGFVVHCGGSLALAVMFCASFYFVEGRLHRFDAAILAVLAYCAVASAILHAHLKNAIAGVLLSALVSGWIVAVGFFHT